MPAPEGEGLAPQVNGEQYRARKTSVLSTLGGIGERARNIAGEIGRKTRDGLIYGGLTPVSMSSEPRGSRTRAPSQSEVEAALNELSGTYLNPTAGNKALDKGMELARQSGLDYTASAGRGEGGFWDVRFDKHEKTS
jgi:hypothetical protein